MRKKYLHWIVLIVVIMMITACQSNPEAPFEGEGLPEQESSEVDSSSPGEAYPSQGETIVAAEEAYPVAGEDLQVLDGSWQLNAYSEDSTAKETPLKTITFDGENYEIITDEGSRSGTWTAQVDSYYPVLILNPEGEAALTYEIVTLSESLLKLRTVKDQMTIEEEYLPVE